MVNKKIEITIEISTIKKIIETRMRIKLIKLRSISKDTKLQFKGV